MLVKCEMVGGSSFGKSDITSLSRKASVSHGEVVYTGECRLLSVAEF